MTVLRLFVFLIFIVGQAMEMASKLLAARNMNDSSHPDAFRVDKRTIGFDPVLQYVSITGEHAFLPPGPGDKRGPCPGLNVLANHGYIPHDGNTTIDQVVKGAYEVFGMGRDLALALAVYSTALDGDITTLSFSIGEGYLDSGSILSPVLSQNGLTGSHNNFEADVSPTRGDLFEYGNNHDVQMIQFSQLYNLQSNISDPSQDNYDIPLLTSFRASRFQQSIENNPDFFNGPLTGIFVQPAAYQFIFHFVANKSEEYPEGRLGRDVLKSFFAITGPDDDLVYNPGHERIPDNWYKRAKGDDYDLASFLHEVCIIALANPRFLSVGGNTGQVNTFTGVNFADLTGGVFNAETLLEGNNVGCYVLQTLVMALPTSPAGKLESLRTELLGNVDAMLKTWNCPILEKIDNSLLEQFPGYSRYPGNRVA
ncbi:Chloroperoxidase [Lentinula aciculospora]|uniref:Chloroperoxidase n=1 Tax=Lentinula aciculospora TaxID=153920 RepID=A0A9W9DDK4_9AGAR|nr:Chloroperoxidase [Lentinula aciculospora]